MKVFHAARQDIEIFVLRFGDVPRPLFDTQVAAMVAGFGEAGRLRRSGRGAGRRLDRQGAPVQRLVGAAAVGVADRLCRGRCDLSPHRVYAAVRAAAAGRPARLGRRGDGGACRSGDVPAGPGGDVGTAASAQQQPPLPRMVRALAAWREREAQRVNIPRQRLLRDETLLEIAATAPGDPEGLARARGISRGFAEGRTGASLLEAIAQAKALPRGRAARGAARAGKGAPAVAGAGVAAEGAARREVRGPPRGAAPGRHPRTTSTGWRPRTHRTSRRCTAGGGRCSARMRWR